MLLLLFLAVLDTHTSMQLYFCDFRPVLLKIYRVVVMVLLVEGMFY